MKQKLLSNAHWNQLRGRYDFNHVQLLFHDNVLQDDDRILDIVVDGCYIDVVLLSENGTDSREQIKKIDQQQLGTPIRAPLRFLLEHFEFLWTLSTSYANPIANDAWFLLCQLEISTGYSNVLLQLSDDGSLAGSAIFPRSLCNLIAEFVPNCFQEKFLNLSFSK